MDGRTISGPTGLLPTACQRPALGLLPFAGNDRRSLPLARPPSPSFPPYCPPAECPTCSCLLVPPTTTHHTL